MKKNRVALVIRPDGTSDVHHLYRKETLNQLQEWVEGYIERVKIRDPYGKVREMYINEEGRLKGLPFNPQATKMFREYWKAGGTSYDIVGTVVVIIPHVDITKEK